MNSDESLWKVEDVGKYLNVSKDTIYTKKMPAIRIRRNWLPRQERIDIWFN